jgi:predicted ester cyclase
VEISVAWTERSRAVRDHDPDPGQQQGLEGLKRWFQDAGAAFLDLRVDVQDLLAEGDRVAARVVFRGTHSGDFQGMAATGDR